MVRDDNFARSDQQLRFHFFLAVWGAKYTQQMISVALPSLMAAGNLPSFANIAASRFVIITRTQDKLFLEACDEIAKLKKLMAVQYIEFDPRASANSHAAMSVAHNLAAAQASADGALAIVLSPDLVMATGSLEHVLRIARSGKRAIMIPGLRLTEETAQPLLAERLARHDASEFLTPRSLVTFALNHLHPEMRQYFWDSSTFTQNPVCCIWPVDDDGLLLRCFHLHPLLVDFREPKALATLKNDTIDGAFVGHSVGNWSDIHIEQDSDNILAFSFSSQNDRVGKMRRNLASEAFLRKTAFARHVNPLHRMFFSTPLFLHRRGVNEQLRLKAEQSGFIVFRIMDVGGLRGIWLQLPLFPHHLRQTFERLVLTETRRVFQFTGLWPYIQRLRGRH